MLKCCNIYYLLWNRIGISNTKEIYIKKKNLSYLKKNFKSKDDQV